MKNITKLFPSKEYRKKIAEEQRFYDTSFAAWLKGKDSWYQGHYLFHMRYAEWYSRCDQSLIVKTLGGVTI